MKRKSAALALAVVVLSVTATQAVPATYQYIGNHFTDVSGVYTTNDFVTATITLAGPLGANENFTQVTPIFFQLSDGEEIITISASPPGFSSFVFSTDASGFITQWHVNATPNTGIDVGIDTNYDPAIGAGSDAGFIGPFSNGFNMNRPGEWTVRPLVSDAGSTLSLMTLTLMALGLVARRFQRAAA